MCHHCLCSWWCRGSIREQYTDSDWRWGHYWSMALLLTRDVREWLLTFPFPWDSRVCYSHSLPFPLPYTQQYSCIIITTVHYYTVVTCYLHHHRYGYSTEQKSRITVVGVFETPPYDRLILSNSWTSANQSPWTQSTWSCIDRQYQIHSHRPVHWRFMSLEAFPYAYSESRPYMRYMNAFIRRDKTDRQTDKQIKTMRTQSHKTEEMTKKWIKCNISIANVRVWL